MRIGSVKAILRYYKEIPGMLKLLREEREDLEEEYSMLHGVAVDGMPHGSSADNRVERLVVILDGKAVDTRLSEIAVRESVLDGDMATIRDALDTINGKYKKIISMRYFDGYSWAKIAVRTGTADSTIRHWHDRALARVGEALSETTMPEELAARASRARG